IGFSTYGSWGHASGPFASPNFLIPHDNDGRNHDRRSQPHNEPKVQTLEGVGCTHGDISHDKGGDVAMAPASIMVKCLAIRSGPFAPPSCKVRRSAMLSAAPMPPRMIIVIPFVSRRLSRKTPKIIIIPAAKAMTPALPQSSDRGLPRRFVA